jgi:uncharacterized protein YkwD
MMVAILTREQQSPGCYEVHGHVGRGGKALPSTSLRSASSRHAGPLLSPRAVALVAAASVALTFSTVVAEAPATDDLVAIERSVFERVNEARGRTGRLPLVADATLAGLARSHSCAMARAGKLEHTLTKDDSLGERMKKAGKRYRAVGENIAFIRGPRDPVSRVVSGWLERRSVFGTALRKSLAERWSPRPS